MLLNHSISIKAVVLSQDFLPKLRLQAALRCKKSGRDYIGTRALKIKFFRKGIKINIITIRVNVTQSLA